MTTKSSVVAAWTLGERSGAETRRWLFFRGGEPASSSASSPTIMAVVVAFKGSSSEAGTALATNSGRGRDIIDIIILLEASLSLDRPRLIPLPPIREPTKVDRLAA